MFLGKISLFFSRILPFFGPLPQGPETILDPPRAPAACFISLRQTRPLGTTFLKKSIFGLCRPVFRNRGVPKTRFFGFFEKNGLWPLEIFENSPDFREFREISENYPENRRFSSENRLFSGIFGVFSGNFGSVQTRSGADPKISGNFREISGPAAAPGGPPLGPVWDPFGTRLGPGGPCLGSVWGPSRVRFGVRLGVRLGSVWDPIGTLFGVPYGP